jgi:hexosaminidase
MSLLLNTLNNMKAIANFFLCFRHISLALFFSGAFLAVSAAGGRIHIIPQPVSVTEKPGDFVLRSGATLVVEGDSLATTAAWFTEQVQALTGIQLRQGKGGKQAIIFDIAHRDKSGIHPNGYSLSVTPSGIRINADDPAGIFYGLQTLLQLIPAGQSPAIPCADITDYPRFAWRGLMLDVSRHFFTKQEVERYIDDMVRYKYNTLHLHLSDDEGWRIEIKSLPQLTQHGAWRVARTGRWGEFLPALGDEAATTGGFYTQDDMREIIRYAQQRYVTILPEIDIPAHSVALISSYPNLSCTQLPYPVNPGARPPVRQDNALCIGNDSVYILLDKIFTELAALFPSEYIHIGGDEAYKGFWATCPKCQRRMADEHLSSVEELQSYFVKRVEKMLTAKGKKLIGWDEILEGGLAPEATVMSWRGMAGGIAAARMGHAVVMTPWDYCYLDLYQGENTVEPPTYGMCRLKDSYTYEPVPDSVDERLILGGQGNLWTESVPNFRQVEYMTWPRGLALAEVYWSPKSARNWDSFTGRMEFEFQRMDGAGIKYARSAYNVILTPKRTADRELVVSMSTEVKGLDIYYTFDNTNPDPYYPKYDGTPVKFPLGATQLNVITCRNGHPIGQQVNIKKEELAKRVDEGRHEY